MHQGPLEQKGPLALGIDAGGTETRWAIACPPGEIVAEGRVAGFSATDLLGRGEGRMKAALEDLAKAVLALGRPARVHAGLTGLGEGGGPLADLVARSLGLEAQAVRLGSDIETAYLDLFAPGQGYLVYAGTGSVAAFIDEAATMHRAGGRGVLIDDAGGGYWVAREALRRIWRAEDERPGSWQDSPMAREVFALIGGPEWALTRQYVYSGTRGDIGRLALAVAQAAHEDPSAEELMRQAGAELARLGGVLIRRHGLRPVTLSGRAATLHPLIPEAMREMLPSGTPFEHRVCHGHHAAARLALAAATGLTGPSPMDFRS